MGKNSDGIEHDDHSWGTASDFRSEEDQKEWEKRSSCFIATAVYGDVMAPEVVLLRNFRDEVLKKHWLGEKFVGFYYKVSPPIAEWLKTKPTLAKFVRVPLDYFVRLIN
jgi:hypothetical protein